MKTLICLLIVLTAGLRAQTTLFATATQQLPPLGIVWPVSNGPQYYKGFMILQPTPIVLHMPVYSKHTLFKMPVLGNDFNLDVSPAFKGRSRFVSRLLYNTEQRFRFVTPQQSQYMP